MDGSTNGQLEQLKAQRYTVQNRLSSVRTRLRGNPPEAKRVEYEERRRTLLAERDRLTGEIKALQSRS